MRKIIDWWGLTPFIKHFTDAEQELPPALTSMPPVPRFVDVIGIIRESGLKLDNFTLHSIVCGLQDILRNLSEDPIGLSRAYNKDERGVLQDKLEQAAGTVVRTLVSHFPMAAWLGEKQNVKVAKRELNWSIFDRYVEAYRKIDEALREEDPEKFARKKALHKKIDEKNRTLHENRGDVPERWFAVLLSYHLVNELVRDQKQVDLVMLGLTSHQASCFKPFFPDDVLVGI